MRPHRFPLTPSDCYETQRNVHPSTVHQPQKASNAIVEISHWFGQ